MKYSFFIQHFDYLEIEPFQIRKPQQNSFIIISIKIQNQHFLALKPFFLRKFIAKKFYSSISRNGLSHSTSTVAIVSLLYFAKKHALVQLH